ncbi:MAG: MFS transporter [Candidatus Omnitrophica bacterium]|nr:MFS transporter [Candidatus Omnitrophota bacterium]
MINYAFIVCAFALSIFFVRFDGYIVNLAMPTFVSYFNVSISRASWISVAYILSQVSTIMLFGKLCDKLEIKKIFIYGLAVFVISSLFCGISPNFWFLIVSRCIQGVGGSMMLVSSYAAMVLYLPRERVGWGLGIMTVSAALGVLLGPVAGGFIIHYINWHWVFLINIPLGLLGLVFGQMVIPHIASPGKFSRKDVDIKGIIFSTAALFLLLYAVNIIDEVKLSSPIVWVSIFLSIVFFIVFYLEEKRSKSPLIDMKLFNNRDFALVILSTIIGFLLFFGGSFLIPFYLTQKGLDTKEIGLLLTVFSLVYMPIGLYAGSLSDKISPRKISCWAMFLAAITGFVFSATLGRQGVMAAVIYLVMLAVSYGLFFSPINHYIMNFADADTRGSVSALYNTSLNISMALGVVAMETIYSEFRIPLDGFRAAFFTGGACCLAVLGVLALLIRKQKNQFD